MNFEKIQNEYFTKSIAEEDQPVLDFLKNLDPNLKYLYLEVGAGLGRFAQLVKNNLKNIDITCLEINKELSNELKIRGLKSAEGDIRQAPFTNNQFDIIHCSHIIEHFGFPEITQVLDELFRIVKPSGYVIFRSPLMHRGFYNNIDHVRPYPPKTIIMYFDYKQQQKKGCCKIKLIKEWQRREPFEININLRGLFSINLFFKLLWNKFGWPKGRPNGYVAIFQKQ